MNKKGLAASNLLPGIIPCNIIVRKKTKKRKCGGERPFLPARGKLRKAILPENSIGLPTGFTATIKLQGGINYG